MDIIRFRYSKVSKSIPTAILSVLVWVFALAHTASAQEVIKQAPQKLEERLATLDKRLEEARIKNKIPGMAIAIVKDDEVVFAKGYGHSDVEAKKPVETETLFAIGSATKSFTGALVGMLVDEGRMQWDDPVTKFIPDFEMKIDTGDEQITVRDLLCHRTGFTRMGILWASGGLTREEVIGQAAHAEAYADFREKFLYNNVMFMAAGMCAARAAESDWDSLIAERIFKPLEMGDSNTTIRVAQKDSRLSLGYKWKEDKHKFEHLPMRNLDSIAPAGSINSNVVDMAQWVRFQLAKGRLNGQQLLSEEQHAETWSKQMKIGGGINYGFGWMLHKWNKKQVVEHGGSIDGFGAQVTLLPELNTGYVLLTNVTATPLQSGSISLVFDTLFGDITEEKSMDAIDTASLVGNYIANFGPFNNATFEVLTKDGNLAIDVPGQTTYELKAPDDKGKWYFALTNTIAISFNKNDEGKVVSITLYQSGMEPEFIREDVELKPETPLKETAALVGKYRDEDGKVNIEVDVRNGRLVVDSGSNGVFVLRPEGEDGKWALRANPDVLQIRFNKNDDGTIKSLSRFQGGKEAEMLRIGESSSRDIPTIDELLGRIRRGYGAIGKADFAGVRMTGIGSFVHQGAEGTVELIFSKTGQHATRQNYGKMATFVVTYDGKRGFSDSSVGRYEELSGRQLKLLRLGHPLWFLDDWTRDYQDASITGESEIDGQETYVVSLSGEDIADRKLHVAADSGLVLKEETVVSVDAVGEIPVKVTYSDHRDVNGIQLPFKIATKNPFNGTYVVQFKSAVALSVLPKDAFVVPPPVHADHDRKP